ncbi:hypothetical protein [Desmospora activa]|uniref:Uncharacterized protein n=1 Tax=Desmospora activa DSM 45169 TaxID=1121389 RepID=A0A2T4YYZ9_9BACL|nr:hypothetical protein [Desmospora activa]PTM52175.1 hypothetical protein C8J48_3722 [Desmospora activa DSM 45169]
MVTEEYLLRVGVPRQHLEQMRKEIIHAHSYYRHFYKKEVEEKNVLVPVNKIRGLLESRGDPGYSWLDHITYRAGCLWRLENFKPWLEELGLETFRKSFADPGYSVELYYYDQEDAYYVGGDGNHRTTWAKIVNAPYISAWVTRKCFLPGHYENYKLLRAKKAELVQTVKEYGLHLREWRDGAHISLTGQGSIWFHVTPQVFDYGNQEKVTAALHQYEKTLGFLQELQELHKRVQILKQPKFRNFFLQLGKGWITDRERKRIYKGLLKLYEEGWPEKRYNSEEAEETEPVRPRLKL